jgi:hypothetical protein
MWPVVFFVSSLFELDQSAPGQRHFGVQVEFRQIIHTIEIKLIPKLFFNPLSILRSRFYFEFFGEVICLNLYRF